MSVISCQKVTVRYIYKLFLDYILGEKNVFNKSQVS